MALTFVQATGATGQTSPTFKAFTSPLTLGNVGFVALGYTDNGVYPTQVFDDIGNTFALVKRTTGDSRGVDLWMALGLVAGTSTVEVSWSGSKANVGIGILEYAPTAGMIFQKDQENDTTDASAVMSFPSGSITTTINDELILYVGRLNQSITTAAGYTARVNLAGSNSCTVLDRIVMATESTNPTPTGASATGYGALVVSFSEVADASALRETQQGRYTLGTTPDPAVLLTQMARYVLYPFTCDVGPTPPASVTYPIRRLRRFLLPSSPDNKVMQIPTVELLQRTGIGLTAGPVGSPVQGQDPQVMMRLSKDGGKTWSSERSVSAAALGKFKERVRLTQATGHYRNGVLEITVSDPVDWQFLAMLGEPVEGSS